MNGPGYAAWPTAALRSSLATAGFCALALRRYQRLEARPRSPGRSGRDRVGASPETLLMIPVPSGVRVWLATGHTDMRAAFTGWPCWCRRRSSAIRMAGTSLSSAAVAAISSKSFGMMARGLACSPSGWSAGTRLALLEKSRRQGHPLQPETLGGHDPLP